MNIALLFLEDGQHQVNVIKNFKVNVNNECPACRQFSQPRMR